MSPLDWYTCGEAGGWQPGIGPWIQTPLSDLASPLAVLDMRLPVGNYVFYFGADDPDSKAEGPWLGLDSVAVTVR